MTSISDPRNFAPPIVNYDEPPVKPPPLLLIGPLAWMRQNLFSSIPDTILTLVGAAFIVGVITSFVAWVVGDANWYAVMFNLRLFMIGRYEPEYEWRLVVLLVYVVFSLGVAFAAWGNISRRVWAVVAVFVALLFILPPLISAFVPPAPTYLGAGNTAVVSGSSSIIPQDQIAFTAIEDETVSIQIATELNGGDDILQNLAGFGDDAANQLRNSAATRLSNIARIAEIEAELAGDLLTQNQRDKLTIELGKLTVPESISETYQLNETPVQVSILRGTTGEVVGEATLDSTTAPLVVTVPESGWYVLTKTVDGEGSNAILRTQGVYPSLERSLTQGNVDEEGNPLPGSARVSQFVRMTDTFTTEEARPTLADENVPILQITDAQFRGTHRFSDYLVLFVGPFLNQINEVILLIAVTLLIGYIIGKVMDRSLSPSVKPRQTSRRVATWTLGAAPILMFILVYGFDVGTLVFFGTVLASTAIWFLLYFAGMSALTWWGMAALIAGFAATLIFSFQSEPIIIALRVLMGVIVAAAGYSQRDSTQPEIALRNLIISGLLAVTGIVISTVLTGILPQALPLTNTQRWGGLLITIMLAVVGIIASFPLGVALALGRRSSLPVISTVSTLYIEFVRGVPLITVLFMAQLLVPLINPSLSATPGIFRAMVAIVLFSAAYLAENIRGGLQSIPPGQEEAAKALGLSGWQITMSITLPQALRAVIPALVGQCISLFKDTSLVVIIGLLDLVGMSKNVVAQTEFLQRQREVLLFIVIIYFVFSYSMSTFSKRIEVSGAGKAMARKI